MRNITLNDEQVQATRDAVGSAISHLLASAEKYESAARVTTDEDVRRINTNVASRLRERLSTLQQVRGLL